MVEKGCGICQCSGKKTEANKKYMDDMYNRKKPSRCRTDLNAENNLYGLAMCQKLPYKDLQFVKGNVTGNDIDDFNDTKLLTYSAKHTKALYTSYKYTAQPQDENRGILRVEDEFNYVTPIFLQKLPAARFNNKEN